VKPLTPGRSPGRMGQVDPENVLRVGCRRRRGGKAGASPAGSRGCTWRRGARCSRRVSTTVRLPRPAIRSLVPPNSHPRPARKSAHYPTIRQPARTSTYLIIPSAVDPPPGERARARGSRLDELDRVLPVVQAARERTDAVHQPVLVDPIPQDSSGSELRKALGPVGSWPRAGSQGSSRPPHADRLYRRRPSLVKSTVVTTSYHQSIKLESAARSPRTVPTGPGLAGSEASCPPAAARPERICR
jgi:hypothetical protein